MSKLKSSGFTLIEVLIVVVIISILAAIGYPSYRDQMEKSRRADAKIALGRAAQLQERWFTQNGSYTNTIANIGGATSDEGHYQIAVTIPAGANCNSGGSFYCYDLTAVPQGVQASDTKCGTFGLNQAGAQSVTGTGAATDCW